MRQKKFPKIAAVTPKVSLTKKKDAKTELLLSEKDERKLLRILESDEFVTAASAKKSLGRF